MIGGRWWHWVVVGLMLASVAAWAVMASGWTGELPSRQRFPATVEPDEPTPGASLTVHLQLTRDPSCYLRKMWRIADSRGVTIVADRAELSPGRREVLPLIKEYRVPEDTTSGRAVLHRRVEWRCNWTQQFTQPGINLEPVFLFIPEGE